MTNLQASKPEHAQTAVGLLDNYAADIVASSILTYLGFAQDVSMEPGADHRRDRLAEGIESYATAKTAEALGELVEMVKYWMPQDQPSHISQEMRAYTWEVHKQKLTKYAPKKDQ